MLLAGGGVTYLVLVCLFFLTAEEMPLRLSVKSTPVTTCPPGGTVTDFSSVW